MDESVTPGRIAPPHLRLVQDLLDTPPTEPTEEELRMAQAIRDAHAAGASQAALAAAHGVSRQLVSAIVRNKRLLAGDGSPGNLGTLASTRAWLGDRGFGADGQQLNAGKHARILALRRALLSWALANSGEPLPPDVRPALTRLATQAPVTPVFDDQAISLAPAGRGADAFIAAVLAAVYDAVRDGTWSRLKACPAARCQGVYYDTSRNRTSTWCSMFICGNRAKVRGYQQRRRAEGTQPARLGRLPRSRSAPDAG